jgi:pimeloyl-ACP methyl ester carboxylesterase
MTTCVLVPGFWLGSWAWDEVAARLRAYRHDVIAVTPKGVAERAGERDVTVESRVDDLVAVLREHRDVVLVGHSMGGVVAMAAAERAREHLARLVLVDTGSLPEGMSFLDFLSPEARAFVEKQLAEHGGWYPMPTREQFAEIGASTEGISAAEFERIRASSTPEPAGTVTGPVRRGTPDQTLPKLVIACSFTEAQARAAIDAGIPGYTEMGDPEWTFTELPTGHWPMFSRPVELTQLIAAGPTAAR